MHTVASSQFIYFYIFRYLSILISWAAVWKCDGNAESDSDSDNDVCITIGDIKMGGSQSNSAPVSLNIKTSGRANLSGADLSDYFNYGFNEDTWKVYCDKQRRLRMSLEVMTLVPSSKVILNRGDLSSKSDYCSRYVYLLLIGFLSSIMGRKSNSSISVIEGQTGTISRVEGRRRHTSEDGNTQVQPSSEQSSDAELQSSKLQSFFPPNIPPPPFPPLSISTTSPLIPPPPPSIGPTIATFCKQLIKMTSHECAATWFPCSSWNAFSSLHYIFSRRSKDITWVNMNTRLRGSHSAPQYPFSAVNHSFFTCPGVYPPLLRAVASWPSIMDSAKAWDYYTRHDKKREREKERERTRDRDRERERDRQREREHTPSFQSRSSDEESGVRHRDHSDRERERHRERAGGAGEREDRYRERRHRERSERHKSSR
ncbi:hypothetical protein NFI96_010854, partial [Prochilodus magdalenae]